MKKIVIIIVSFIYFIAVVLIAFLGIRSEVNPSKIVTEVETIVLDEVKGDEDGIYEYHYDGTESEDSLVYSVYQRPAEDEINKTTGTDIYGNLWNIGTEKMNFIVTFYNFNYIYDTDNWIGSQNKGTYQINASVIPENSTIQDLSYTTTNVDDVTLSEKGLLTFNKFDQITRFTVKIKARDNSGTTVNVRFISQAYL